MNIYVPSSNNSLCSKLLLWPLNAWGVLPGAADPPPYGPDWSCFVHCPAGLGWEVQIESRLGSPCHVALAFFLGEEGCFGATNGEYFTEACFLHGADFYQIKGPSS